MITDLLKVSLANHIESSLIVQSYHWNIEGADFNQYHEFFDEIYSTYASEIDRLAEYIRIVSKGTDYANGSVDVVKVNKTVKANPIVGDKFKEMCLAIIELNNTLLDDFSQLFDESTKENEQGLANYCADKIDALNKLNWKLVAITK